MASAKKRPTPAWSDRSEVTQSDVNRLENRVTNIQRRQTDLSIYLFSLAVCVLSLMAFLYITPPWSSSEDIERVREDICAVLDQNGFDSFSEADRRLCGTD